MFSITSLIQVTLKEVSGTIILVGGGNVPAEISHFLAEGQYVVIATHPLDAQCVWDHICKVACYLTPDKVTDDIFNISGFAGVIINGGDQWEYLTMLDGGVIQRVYDRGFNIVGTSAGAMILGEYYFSAQFGTISSDQARLVKEFPIGKAFVRIAELANTIVDTHYSERFRQGRLGRFMETCGAGKAIGIDESTALIIGPDGEWKSCGAGKVYRIGV
jgi:hypothetical protein